MADKFKKTLPVDITFTGGENLLPSKLNALSSSIRSALSTIESFLGDGWDDSYPYFSTSDTLTPATQTNSGTDLGASKKLEIVNLSRLIGPSSALNPMHLSDLDVADKPITETVPSSVNHFRLRYTSIDTSTISFSGGAGIFDTRKTNVGTVLVAGDYYVDSNTGEVVTVAPTTTGITITYSTSSTWDAFASYSGATFNVIPDPAQSTKCTVTGPSAGRYTLTLPVITHQEANDSVTLTTLAANNYNYQAQLKLPKALEVLTPGMAIPAGFLVVRDDVTNEIYRSATYIYQNETTLEISDVTLDVTHGFSVITVGTNITQSIQNLQYKLYRLRRGLDTAYAINIENVIGKAGPSRNTGLGPTAEPYVYSEAPNNHFPQYLHRDGWFGSYYDDNNINDSNGMRGDLVMLSTSRVTNSRNNLAADSQKIRFGHATDGPSIGFDEDVYSSLFYDAGTSLYHRFNKVVSASDGFSVGSIAAPNVGPIKWEIDSGSLTINVSETASVTIASLIGKTIIGLNVLVDLTNAGGWVAPGNGLIVLGSDIYYQAGINSSSGVISFEFAPTWRSLMADHNYNLIVFYMD